MQAYCMKCRARREMKEAKSITMKNGELAAPGVGPDVRRQDAQKASPSSSSASPPRPLPRGVRNPVDYEYNTSLVAVLPYLLPISACDRLPMARIHPPMFRGGDWVKTYPLLSRQRKWSQGA